MDDVRYDNENCYVHPIDTEVLAEPNQYSTYNCARGYRETMGVIKYRLPAPTMCLHCRARKFHRETSDMCCSNGKVVLRQIPYLAKLLNLVTDQQPWDDISDNIYDLTIMFSHSLQWEYVSMKV